MEKESVVFHKEWMDAIAHLAPEIRLEIYECAIMYATTGKMNKLSDTANIAFGFMKPRIDRDKEKYKSTVERNRGNGAKGGRPKNEEPKKPTGLPGLNENPHEPKKPKKADTVTDTDSEYDTDTGYDNENDSVSLPGESARVAPEDEEREMIKHLIFEKRLITPQKELQRFRDHYAKTGWKDKNGTHIVDRMAALRSWDHKPDAPKFPPEFIKKWKMVYDYIRDPILLTDLSGATLCPLAICITTRLKTFIENNAMEALLKAFPGVRINFKIRYHE